MKNKEISYIQLRGEPYQRQLSNGETVDCNHILKNLADNTGFPPKINDRIDAVSDHLDDVINKGGYYAIDAQIKRGADLSFDQSFSLLALVLSATNKPFSEALSNRTGKKYDKATLLQAVSLLSAMSSKEAYSRLTSREIAGMVAATLHLDTVAKLETAKPTIAFGGMGGDQGYPIQRTQSKLFSLSTLSAVATAVLAPTHKHHSYPNTSKVAGQSAIEEFGARSDFYSLAAFNNVFEQANLLMTSCHTTRTLHSLPHQLRGETVNHVIGPLAFTLANEVPIQAMIGVNEKVHPETIAEAMLILDKLGYQTYDNSAVFCGTDLECINDDLLDPDSYYASSKTRKHIKIDEVAPPPFASLAAFIVKGQNLGTFALYPEDFFTRRQLSGVSFESLAIPNTKEDIIHFNRQALTGQDESKAKYLAMTIGLGVFVRNYLGYSDALDIRSRRVNPTYLRRATEQGYEVLRSGQALQKLEQYVHVTTQFAGKKGGL